jgi:TetR/AcrR family transcriptional regulator, ethionamide resistance regulator
VPTKLSPVAARRRPRHSPQETEREILLAGEQLLRERPFREINVEQIMLRTGLKRPAFYAHFRDRHDLVLRLVEHIGDQMFQMARRWLDGEEPEQDIRAALEGVAAVYMRHGPVLQALVDGVPSDARVESAYRALVQSFIDATAEHICSEQTAGRIFLTADPYETARALVWLNERYLSEAFGRQPPDDPLPVIGVLHHIWLATLYASADRGR